MKKKRYSDNELLDGVYNRDGQVIKHIMNMVWGPIQDLVFENSGKRDDAMNIIQEGFIAIYSKTEKPQLTCSFSTYFYSICKHLWMNELRVRKNESSLLAGFNESPYVSDEIEEKKMYEKRRKLYLKYYQKITKVCQDVLRLVAIGFSNEDITAELAFSSVQYMKNRRSMCNKKLIEMIKADPQYKELKYGL